MGLFGDPKMAMCPKCYTPLIATMAFDKYEFYCLECGHKCGYMSPRPAEPTDEVTAHQERLQEEWDKNVGNSIIPQHQYPHATDERKELHATAINWLKDRVRSGN